MGRRLQALIVVAFVLIGLVAGALWLHSERFFEGLGWTGIILASFFGVGLLSLLGLLRRRRHSGVIVLWCRRFGETSSLAGARNRWMWALVTEASRALAFPVTLRDASLRGAQTVGRSFQTPFIVLALVLALPAWLASVLWLDDRFSAWLNNLLFAVSLVAFVGLFVGIGRLAGRVTTAFAATPGDPDSIRKKLRAAKKRGWTGREMGVFHCANDGWEKSVEAMLEVVDLVILDATESSENLSWETRLAVNRLGGEGVLVLSPQGLAGAAGVASLEYDEREAAEEIAALTREWGEDDFSDNEVALGPYGREVASRLREWLGSRR